MFTREDLRMVYSMRLGYICGMMGGNTSVLGAKEKNMDMEYLFGQMVGNMRAIGKMICLMGLGGMFG